MTIPNDRLFAAKAGETWCYLDCAYEDLTPEELKENSADFAARLLKLQPWAEKARKVLREIEWNCYNPDDSDYGCPSCEMYKHAGHAPSCAIAALLQEDIKNDNSMGRANHTD